MVSFPFDVTEDRVRFQKSIVEGDKGYYDTISKKFIPQDILDGLIKNIIPEKEYQITSGDNKKISDATNRIRRNLSLYQKNPSDSYAQIFLKYISDRFLKSISEHNMNAAILYVDVVGSTKLATRLSPEELSSLIRVFSQEMSIIISRHTGFVLKYAGDAVIAYFPHLEESDNVTENAIRCGKSMMVIVQRAINNAFQDFALPQIQIRVSIDFGDNEIVFLGPEPDLIGRTITITSKMNPFAQPCQIIIGQEAFRQLSNIFSEKFKPLQLDSEWNYTSPETGKTYPLYGSINE